MPADCQVTSLDWWLALLQQFLEAERRRQYFWGSLRCTLPSLSPGSLSGAGPHPWMRQRSWVARSPASSPLLVALHLPFGKSSGGPPEPPCEEAGGLPKHPAFLSGSLLALQESARVPVHRCVL